MGLFDDPEKMNQLMASPLVQMGLGMLANNKGQYAMQNALGGAGQGFTQSQEYAQQNAMNALRKQQFDIQNKQFEQTQDQYNITKARQAKVDAWQGQYGKPNAGSVVSGGYSPAPVGVDAPNFNMVKNPDTMTENNTFDQAKWLQSGIGSGAINPIEYMNALQKSSDDYSMEKGYVLNKKTGVANKVEGYDTSADGGTPDIKNYEYAKARGYQGSLTDYIRIKPQAMMPIAMGNLGVAQANLGISQQRADIDQARADYSLPATPKPKTQTYSVTAGGNTYTFKDKKSMNNFKLQAGVR